ncbi:MAG: nuclear mRNA export, poly(A)+RNA binding protein [Trichoglossum hirsutum]|nr:MAG: nuclear mRNA export, poly(A)+RNA binding protein [Trichoglossum hirsutum]
MLQRTSAPPTGPRGRPGARNNNSLTTTISRGGIRKRRSGTPRLDRDGDLDMDGPVEDAGGRGRGSRARGGHSGSQARGNASAGRDQSRNGPQGGFFGGAGMQQAILRGMARGDARVRGPRAGFGIASALSEATGRRRERDGGLDQIRVRGLKESKAALNEDGGVSDLLAFLERKANGPDTKPGDAVRIKKSHPEGDSMIIYVRPEDAPKILRLNAFQFAHSTLNIERCQGASVKGGAGRHFESSDSTSETKQFLIGVLNRRYRVEQKLLDLSKLGTDETLIGKGFFGQDSTASKLFPALMKIADQLFTSPREKREAVFSVSLSDNELRDISTVSSLAQTFPDIKNLDLSNNNLINMRSLDGWRWRFRNLEQLVLVGNPMETLAPSYKDDILTWYPTLRILNGVQVRSDQELAALAASRALTSVGKLPIPIRAAHFLDEGQIGENFVKHFFPAYDLDRTNLANSFYDLQSTFSFSVNTSAPRAPGGEAQKSLTWDAYIKGSRNLKKLSHLSARMARVHTGTEDIRNCWSTLPATRHPDLLSMGPKWVIECHSLPGLVDVTGQSAAGVGGLIVIVHGEFDEIDVSTGNIGTKRSFDRTFVLGPGAGIGGIRVVSDMLTLRAYGGYESFAPEDVDASTIAGSTSVVPKQPQIPEGLGVAMEGKSPEQLNQELMVLEMSKQTGMTLEYSHMCLREKAWDFESATKAFQDVKGNLPPNAWL